MTQKNRLHENSSQYGPEEMPDYELIESIRRKSRELQDNLGDIYARFDNYTSLRQLLRNLRNMHSTRRETWFYQALIEVDDCVRKTELENVSSELVKTLSEVAEELNPEMNEEAMLKLTERLFRAGWRPLAKR